MMKARLAGRSVLLTGATGFVGKALLGQVLRELPETEVTVLLRGDAERRLRDEVLTSAPCEGLDGSAVKAVSGDVAHDGLQELGPFDVVIHCAASVSFELPLDEALELNGKGPARLLAAVRGEPYFVHVSTAYAAGQRTGLVLERPSGSAPSEPELDLEAELDAARAWRRDLEAGARPPPRGAPTAGRSGACACTRGAWGPRPSAPPARPAGRRSARGPSSCGAAGS